MQFIQPSEATGTAEGGSELTYLVWTLPALVVIAAIASGRVGTLVASIIGLFATLAVALTTAPHGFQIPDAIVSLARGAWIGWIVVPYFLGGLLFWQMAIRPGNAAMPVGPPRPTRAQGAGCCSPPAS
jgi:lactate permease